MSWNIKKVGVLKDELKLSIQTEFAPQAVKDEICLRIETLRDTGTANEVETGKVIFVESYGHLDTIPERPYNGLDTMVIRVQTIPLINTPLSQPVTNKELAEFERKQAQGATMP